MILKFDPKFERAILNGTKFSTIREDKKNRWTAGAKIDFRINTGGTNSSRKIATGVVQSVTGVKVDPTMQKVFIRTQPGIDLWEPIAVMRPFVLGKGFANEGEFWQHFNSPVVGKLIYWSPATVKPLNTSADDEQKASKS